MGLLDFLFGNKEKKELEAALQRKKEAERKRQEMFAQIEKRQEERNKEEARKKQVKKSGKAFLAIFSAEWCGPSKKFIKEIQAAGINNYALIDAEKEETLSTKFSITSVPTVLLLDENDNIIKKWIGYDDEDPGQSKFINYIKTVPYTILPFNPDKETPEQRTAARRAAHFNEMTRAKINEDHRKRFYNLEDIKYRSMGKDLMLAPYDAFSFFNYPDAEVLPQLTNSEKIRRFLPGLGFTDEASTKKRLQSFIYKVENQLGVTYVIRFSNIPFGMIFVNTPLYNQKTMNLAIWTIDFYISDIYEHKGLMYHSIVRTLNEMKEAMGAKEVYAIVDKNNHDCINVIGKGLFQSVDNTGFHDGRGGEAPLVYMIDLSRTNFQRQ